MAKAKAKVTKATLTPKKDAEEKKAFEEAEFQLDIDLNVINELEKSEATLSVFKDQYFLNSENYKLHEAQKRHHETGMQTCESQISHAKKCMADSQRQYKKKLKKALLEHPEIKKLYEGKSQARISEAMELLIKQEPDVQYCNRKIVVNTLAFVELLEQPENGEEQDDW